MRRLYYITHADVVQDPAVPVTDWPLSERGRARHQAFSGRMPPLGAVFCSMERKAIDGAEILAAAQGLVARQALFLHENDRSATGYLPPAEFETVADAFFANPRRSVRGWERAIDAQYRVLATLKRLLPEAPEVNAAASPLDVNRAAREMLLRLPGFGTKTVNRILTTRRHRTLRYDDLLRLGAHAFATFAPHKGATAHNSSATRCPL